MLNFWKNNILPRVTMHSLKQGLQSKLACKHPTCLRRDILIHSSSDCGTADPDQHQHRQDECCGQDPSRYPGVPKQQIKTSLVSSAFVYVTHKSKSNSENVLNTAEKSPTLKSNWRGCIHCRIHSCLDLSPGWKCDDILCKLGGQTQGLNRKEN